MVLQRIKRVSSNKGIASSNRCLTSSNKKLVVTSASLVVTRASLLGAIGRYYRGSWPYY